MDAETQQIIYDMDIKYAKDWLREKGYHKSYYECDKYAEMLVEFGRDLLALDPRISQ